MSHIFGRPDGATSKGPKPGPAIASAFRSVQVVLHRLVLVWVLVRVLVLCMLGQCAGVLITCDASRVCD